MDPDFTTRYGDEEMYEMINEDDGSQYINESGNGIEVEHLRDATQTSTEVEPSENVGSPTKSGEVY
jgi:hypothetical protein